MQNEFLPYDRALKLKQLGYDEEGFGTYNVNGEVLPLMPYTVESKAILFQQAFRWFREEHGLGHMINGIGYESFLFNIGGLVTVFPMFKTYEEAELACLDKLIEIVESKKEEDECNIN